MIDSLSIKGKIFTFEVTPGVFAQYGLDFGSKLLLENIPIPERLSVLDLGSGCGVMGITIAGLSPKSTVYLADSDIRAVRLSKENAQRNEVDNTTMIISDGVSDLPNDLKFDLVVSNPPTHQGREVLVQFIKGAHSVLKKGGEAYFVVNRMTSTIKKLKQVFKSVEKIKKKQGYIVYKAVK